MSLIVLEKASLFFGPQRIFEQLNMRVGAGEKIGLIGANGSGKSTLLKIMVGLQGLDSGLVVRTKGCRIGYLAQDITDISEGTLLGSVLAAVPGRGDLEEKLVLAQSSLEGTDEPDEQMKHARRLADLNDQLDHFELYYNEHQAMRILKGLGFKERDFKRPTEEFSGGWRMRAALASLLFQQPDVLFLDEPTNHLDIPSVLWFSEFLSNYRQAMVLICHDRDFLNRHIERVVSFEPEGVRFYKGNYDSYLEQRSAEETVLEAQARNREKQIKELERFVERFKAKATKARQAQSRAKQIKKLEREIERPLVKPRRLSFSFPSVERSGKDVVTLENVSKAYGENILYRNFSRGIYAGDRLAIIGANGVGKTTLLKILVKELEPDSGIIRYGSGVQIGYYAQHHTELLDRNRTVLEEVWSVCPSKGESFVRGVCGAFLFSGDNVEKRISVLSGGERARVLLAKLLVLPGNLLLMDEPTTHLDIAAAEALAEALRTYEGTLVLVSHNTSFVNHLATKVWDVTGEEVIEHPSNLSDYLEHKARLEATLAVNQDAAVLAQQRAPESISEKKPTHGETRLERKERKRLEAERRNALSQKTRCIRQTIAELEEKIGSLESEKSDLEPQLADPNLCALPEKYREVVQRYSIVAQELEELYQKWENQQLALEQATAEFDEAV